jgi:hypothetical protein
MELLNIAIDISELNALAACKTHYNLTPKEELPHPDVIAAEMKKAEDHTFFRCRIELNGKKMQMESPIAKHYHRQEMLMQFIEKAWAEISAQAFPPSEAPMLILPS